jgi:hypothetical protein
MAPSNARPNHHDEYRLQNGRERVGLVLHLLLAVVGCFQKYWASRAVSLPTRTIWTIISGKRRARSWERQAGRPGAPPGAAREGLVEAVPVQK